MAVGSFGDVVFEASAEKVRTFSDMARKGSAQYATHEIINKKAKLEFIAPANEEITFKMQLARFLGINPDEELDALREMRDTGQIETLILGETKIGKFVITDITQTEAPRDNKGNAVYIDVDLTLKEYAEDD